jgi:hypothetical protein
MAIAGWRRRKPPPLSRRRHHRRASREIAVFGTKAPSLRDATRGDGVDDRIPQTLPRLAGPHRCSPLGRALLAAGSTRSLIVAWAGNSIWPRTARKPCQPRPRRPLRAVAPEDANCGSWRCRTGLPGQFGWPATGRARSTAWLVLVQPQAAPSLTECPLRHRPSRALISTSAGSSHGMIAVNASAGCSEPGRRSGGDVGFVESGMRSARTLGSRMSLGALPVNQLLHPHLAHIRPCTPGRRSLSS